MADNLKPDEVSNLERLERKLYTPESENMRLRRTKILPRYNDFSQDWPAEEKQAPDQVTSRSTGSRWLWRLLWASIIFFVMALGVAGYILFFGTNIISSGNIDFEVEGPVLAKAGEELALNVLITNKNSQPMQRTSLKLQYPAGSRSLTGQLLNVVTENLGDISPGQSIRKTVSAVVFGQENLSSEVKMTLGYMVPGSNALFQKERDYAFTISSSPLTLNVNIAPEVNSDREVPITVRVGSNSQTLVSSVALSVSYPPGFRLGLVEPATAFGNNTWQLGDIQPGEERIIKLNGTFVGQDGDLKSLEFKLGTLNPKNSQKMSLTYNDLLKSVTVKRSFLDVDLAINGQTGETFISDKSTFSVGLDWVNNLTSTIADAQIAVMISGDIFNPLSVITQNGFYRSQDNSILFDSQLWPALVSLDPAARGSTGFGFKIYDPGSGPNGKYFKNPEITLDAKISGTRVSEGFSGQLVTTEVVKKIKIESPIAVRLRSLHSSGSLENSGPIPPKVDRETTYTIVLSAINPYNDLQNAVITTVLPFGVNWQGVISPSTESISYNEKTKTASWNIGKLSAGVGYGAPVREASFQVSILPSASQVGQSASLAGPAQFSALDSFTQTTVSTKTSSGVTTETRGDPDYPSNGAQIVK